jgi:hypothetical protein
VTEWPAAERLLDQRKMNNDRHWENQLTATMQGPMAEDSLDLVTDPVFLLCAARTGSTLLRFILDSHPDLSCPAESNFPATCVQLASLLAILAPGQRPMVDPNIGALQSPDDSTTRELRHVMDTVVRAHLSATGKRRFCDKSLGSWKYLGFLLQVFPESKFVCLYRHPMDFIKSGLEACPWGLSGYGFETYASVSPSNSVDALARYWLDNTSAIFRAADENPDRCYSVRYEDLADAPEEVASRLFDFLGVSPQPGISTRCFTPERDLSGPSDFKIWFTSAVHTGSVGRAENIPAQRIQPGLRSAMNDMLDRLGYVRIEPWWGTPGSPSDPRLPGTGLGSERPSAATEVSPSAEKAVELLGDRARDGVKSIDDAFRRRWSPYVGGPAALVSRSSDSAEARWVLDFERGELARDDDPYAWCIVGAPEEWQAVLSGEMTLAASCRRGTLRYCGPTEDARMGGVERRWLMVSELLGL